MDYGSLGTDFSFLSFFSLLVPDYIRNKGLMEKMKNKGKIKILHLYITNWKHAYTAIPAIHIQYYNSIGLFLPNF